LGRRTPIAGVQGSPVECGMGSGSERRDHRNVIHGDAIAVELLTAAAILERFDDEELQYQALIPAMTEVRQYFESHEFQAPEMLVAARAMKYGVRVLRPSLVNAGSSPLAPS
jgi:methanogenic corrinoid protein MtbC1